MAWFKMHQELFRHPKLKRFARQLGISEPTAVGHLCSLWSWAMDYAQDGDLTRFKDDDIAFAMQWEGEPAEMVEALITCGVGGDGFLERADDGRLVLHNWEEHCGARFRQRSQGAERIKRHRERRAQNAQKAQTCNAHVTRYTCVTDALQERYTCVSNATVTRGEERRGEEKKGKEILSLSSIEDNSVPAVAGTALAGQSDPQTQLEKSGETATQKTADTQNAQEAATQESGSDGNSVRGTYSVRTSYVHEQKEREKEKGKEKEKERSPRTPLKKEKEKGKEKEREKEQSQSAFEAIASQADSGNACASPSSGGGETPGQAQNEREETAEAKSARKLVMLPAAAAFGEAFEAAATSGCTLSQVIVLWNAELAALGFPKVQKGTPARERAFTARVAEQAARRDLDWWRERIAQLAASEFMRSSARDKAGWLTFDWLLNENNLVKVQEGKYDSDRVTRPRSRPRMSLADMPDDIDAFEAALGMRRGGGKVISLDADYRELGEARGHD